MAGGRGRKRRKPRQKMTMVRQESEEGPEVVPEACEKESDMVPEATEKESEVVPELVDEGPQYTLWGDKIPDNYRFRPTGSCLSTVRVWHGGSLVGQPRVEYVNGTCKSIENWDVDMINSIELAKAVKRLGYVSFKVWYKQHDLPLGSACRPFENDEDVIRILEYVKGHNELDFYVEHLVEPETVSVAGDVDEGQGVSAICFNLVEDEVNEGEGVGADGNEGQSKEGEDGSEVHASEGIAKVPVFETVEPVSETVEVVESVEATVLPVVGTVDEPTVEAIAENEPENQSTVGATDNEVNGAENERENEPTVGAPDNEDNGDEVDETFDDVVDEIFDEDEYDDDGLLWAKLVDEERDESSEEEDAIYEEEHEEASDELDTPPNSDDEDQVQRRKIPSFKSGEEDVKLILGQKFRSSSVFKSAIRAYSVQKRKNLIMEKSDRSRVVFKCEGECPFYCRLAKYVKNTFWMITVLVDVHTCPRSSKNRHAKPQDIAKLMLPSILHNPGIKVKSVVSLCQANWGLSLSRYQTSRIRAVAKKMISGAEADQYKHLHSYADELRRSNPNSTVIITTSAGVGEGEGEVFERMYVCFAACKHAFANTCRPLIGLDGCFLKGVYGGQLLTAVGKEGNNNIFPIAFTIVEAETKDSWQWFVHLLLTDLNSISRKPYSFISDQQKGLIPTLAALEQTVESRVCVGHMYGNWRKKFPGEELKNALWAAARATSVPQFDWKMNKLKEINEEAWKDLNEIPPKHWSKAHFSTYSLCDLQVNNMCESFNMAILEHREKPIISLVEGLKHYISARIVKQRRVIHNLQGSICPQIQRQLEANKKVADNWTVHWCGDADNSKFEVSNSPDFKYVVDLKEKKCACRRWDLTGISCGHAIACMWYNQTQPEEYVADWYRRDTFVRTYGYIIFPNNGAEFWTPSPLPQLNPPYVRRAPGRPKTKRNKNNDEPSNPYRIGRREAKGKCSRCGNLGHNIKTCGGKTGADRDIPVGGNKKNKRKLHPKDKPSGRGTKQDATQIPRHKPAAKRKKKAPKETTNAASTSVAPVLSQASTITEPSTIAGTTTRGRKRARTVVGTQESTIQD